MRRLLIAFSALILFSCSSSEEGPYNVIILFTDDQRHNTIHALGNDEIITPNMDRLADEGMAFTRAHVAGSIHGAVCAPSRAMLLSGRSFFSIPRGFMGGGGDDKLPFVTMPELYREAGYNTFFTGKWHNSTYLINQAFSHASDLYIGGMHWPRDGGHDTPLLQPYDSAGIYPSSAKKKADKFSSEVYADAAIEFINDYGSEKPFFMYVSFTSPHDPRMAPEKYTSMYDLENISLPQNFLPQHPFDNGDLRVRDELLQPFPRTPEAIREDILAYYAMVTEVDANIGRVLESLDQQGLAENTIVVFAGDNGLAMGQHGLLGKQSLYDHSSRVPLIIRAPNTEKMTDNSLVYLYDVFPTLCEMTGLDIPESVQGRSLISQCNVPRDHLFTAYRNTQRAVRTNEDLKLIKYNVNGDLNTQLFDISKDPWEINNLADDPGYSEQYDALSKLLISEIMDHGDQFLTPVISSHYSDFKTKPGVLISKSFDAVDLRYTIDGSEPGPDSEVYSSDFRIDSSTTVKVRAFYDGAPVSETVSRRIDTLGGVSDASLTTDPAGRYRSQGIFTLVDKERGTTAHADGRWLGYKENDFEAIIDLGATRKVKEIKMGCLQSTGSWIFYPESITISTSNDGRSWQQHTSINPEVPKNAEGSKVYDFGQSVDVATRYIKVNAKPLERIPDWHDGKGTRGWLFVDEIIVNSE